MACRCKLACQTITLASGGTRALCYFYTNFIAVNTTPDGQAHGDKKRDVFTILSLNISLLLYWLEPDGFHSNKRYLLSLSGADLASLLRNIQFIAIIEKALTKIPRVGIW